MITLTTDEFLSMTKSQSDLNITDYFYKMRFISNDSKVVLSTITNHRAYY